MISIEDGCKCGLPPVDFAPRATKCGSIVKESIKRDRMRNEYMERSNDRKEGGDLNGNTSRRLECRFCSLLTMEVGTNDED